MVANTASPHPAGPHSRVRDPRQPGDGVRQDGPGRQRAFGAEEQDVAAVGQQRGVDLDGGPNVDGAGGTAKSTRQQAHQVRVLREAWSNKSWVTEGWGMSGMRFPDLRLQLSPLAYGKSARERLRPLRFLAPSRCTTHRCRLHGSPLTKPNVPGPRLRVHRTRVHSPQGQG